MSDSRPLLGQRRSGVLLHPSCLPGPGASGSLGPQAHRFVDFLQQAGQSVWQMLPLGPSADGCPYTALSVHAGNPQLISAELLRDKGWLDPGNAGSESGACVERFSANAEAEAQHAYARFKEANSDWLDDYVLFRALREAHGRRAWTRWPAELRERNEDALAQARAQLGTQLERLRFEQFVFFDQWEALKGYANKRGMRIFGDMPIFVAHDSADVWAQREYFRLAPDGEPAVVAGVPPDYFSQTGQRWGNPLYDWERMRADGFGWWRRRMRSQLHLFDIVRIDHFRGFEACWEVPANEETAMNGRWVPAPGDALFTALAADFPELPVVAEDLGYITPEVHALRHRYGFPGMLVLQFAFDSGPDNPYLPHNHPRNAVVYTGTHDNDTTLSWFQALDDEQRRHVLGYLGWREDPMPWPLIRSALASPARLAIVPMQDILGLGPGHRMNTPGTTSEGNWRWRFSWEQLSAQSTERLAAFTRLYGR